MFMRRLREAAMAARNSLVVSGYIYDHRENIVSGMMWTLALNRPQLCEEDLFFTYSYVSLFAFTEKMMNTFEDCVWYGNRFRVWQYGLPNVKLYMLGLMNTFLAVAAWLLWICTWHRRNFYPSGWLLQKMFVHRPALGGGFGQLQRFTPAWSFAYHRRFVHRRDGPLSACQPFCTDSPELCGQSVRYRHVYGQHVAYRR